MFILYIYINIIPLLLLLLFFMFMTMGIKYLSIVDGLTDIYEGYAKDHSITHGEQVND